MKLIVFTNSFKKVIEAENKRQEGFVGELLKIKRLQHNYTQETLAKSICSISYLSKIENNQLSPSTFIIREIEKRLDHQIVEFYEFTKGENFIAKLARAFYYQDQKLLEILSGHLEHFHDHPIQILFKVMNGILDESYDAVKEDVDKLEPLIKGMNQDSNKFYGVLAGIHAYHSSKYHEAMNIFHSIENLYTSIGEIKTLESFYYYLTKAQVGLMSSGSNYYLQAEQYLGQHPHTKYGVLLPLYKAYFTAMDAPKLAEQMIAKMYYNQFPESHINLYVATALLGLNSKANHQGMLDIYEQLDHTNKNEWYYQAIMAYEVYCKEHTIDFKSPIKLRDLKDIQVLSGFEYKLKLMKNQNEKVEFVHEIALPYAIEKQAIQYIELFSDVLIKEAENNSRYKEAIMSIRKRDKAIAKIQKLI